MDLWLIPQANRLHIHQFLVCHCRPLWRILSLFLSCLLPGEDKGWNAQLGKDSKHILGLFLDFLCISVFAGMVRATTRRHPCPFDLQIESFVLIIPPPSIRTSPSNSPVRPPGNVAHASITRCTSSPGIATYTQPRVSSRNPWDHYLFSCFYRRACLDLQRKQENEQQWIYWDTVAPRYSKYSYALTSFSALHIPCNASCVHNFLCLVCTFYTCSWVTVFGLYFLYTLFCLFHSGGVSFRVLSF